MPDSYYESILIQCDDLRTTKINCDRVQINNSERPLEIKNDEGKVVFFVDSLGANIPTINSTTSFFELSDSPNEIGSENSLIGVRNEKLDFVNEIKLNNISAEEVTSNNIVSSTVKSLGITSDSIKTESLIVNDITATDLSVKNIKTDHIACNNMKIENFKTSKSINEELDCKKAEIKSLTTESITSNNLASTNIIVENLENKTANITDILNETLISNSIKSTSVNALQIVAEKNVVAAEIYSDLVDTKEIKCNKLSIHKNVYGTHEEPLDLAVTRVKSVTVEGDLIIIHSKIPSGVLNQEITVHGLENDGDYVVSMTFNSSGRTKDDNLISPERRSPFVNDITHMFVNTGNDYKLLMKYKERVERESQVKIIIQKV